MCDYLAQQLQAGDKVGIIEGVSTTTNAQQRTAGFKDAMDAAKMNIVGVQSGNWEIANGNTVAAGMMRENPDLKALLAGNDSMALGAVAAIEAAGRIVGEDIYVLGVDALEEAVQLIKSGEMTGTVLNDHIGQSHKAVEVAIAALNGEEIDNYYWVDYVKVDKAYAEANY